MNPLDLVADMNRDAGRVKCRACSKPNWDVWHLPYQCPTEAVEVTQVELNILRWAKTQDAGCFTADDCLRYSPESKRIADYQALQALLAKGCICIDRPGGFGRERVYMLTTVGESSLACAKLAQPTPQPLGEVCEPMTRDEVAEEAANRP